MIRVRVRVFGIVAMMGIELVVSQMTLSVTLEFRATNSDVSMSECVSEVVKICGILDQELCRVCADDTKATVIAVVSVCSTTLQCHSLSQLRRN